MRAWTYEQDSGRRSSPAPFEGIWAGLSGVNHGSDFDIMQKALSELFGWETGERIRVTNDCDLLAAAIELHRQSAPRGSCDGGIVLIAGTGSVAMAFKPVSSASDELVPVGRGGGLGFLLGDEGSAYHIGRETLKGILDAADRGELGDRLPASDVARSTLVPLVLQHYGISTPHDLLGAVYALGGAKNVNEHDRKVRIAEVSRCTMACAYPSRTASLAESRAADGVSGGDPFALRVLDASATCLSKLVRDLTAMHALDPARSVLSLGGGTWGYEAFKATVLEVMKTDWGAEWGWVEVVRDPDGTGAMALALAAP